MVRAILHQRRVERDPLAEPRQTFACLAELVAKSLDLIAQVRESAAERAELVAQLIDCAEDNGVFQIRHPARLLPDRFFGESLSQFVKPARQLRDLFISRQTRYEPLHSLAKRLSRCGLDFWRKVHLSDRVDRSENEIQRPAAARFYASSQFVHRLSEWAVTFLFPELQSSPRL